MPPTTDEILEMAERVDARLSDQWHDDLCGCSGWVKGECLSGLEQAPGFYDTFNVIETYLKLLKEDRG